MGWLRAERIRLGLLLDPGSPFLELSPLAAHGVYPGQDIPGAGLIAGIGRISGRECVIVVNDATVKGGSYYPLTVCGVPAISRPERCLQSCRLRNTYEHRKWLVSMVSLAFMLVGLLRYSAGTRQSDLPEPVESGGAALPYQANVFPDKEHFGRIFYNMVRVTCFGYLTSLPTSGTR